MANRNDGLAEVLVQLAGNAATLIERARASAAMKAAQTVDAEATARSGRDTPEDAAADADGQRGALQDIIVQQAMRMHQQDAEIAALKAEIARLVAERDALKAAARAVPKKPKPAKPQPKAAAK